MNQNTFKTNMFKYYFCKSTWKVYKFLFYNWVLICSLFFQSMICMRVWMTGRFVRCLKARTGSIWKSNSSTGSSLWSWTNSVDTSPSSRMRSPKRGQTLSQDRWACHQEANLRKLKVFAVKLQNRFLYFVTNGEACFFFLFVSFYILKMCVGTLDCLSMNSYLIKLFIWALIKT